MRTCDVTDCDRKHDARGYCRKHYKQWARLNGRPSPSVDRPHTAERYEGMPINDMDIGAYLHLLRNEPCAYCGGPSDVLDHIHPRSKGGENYWANFTPACNACNDEKSSHTLLGYLLARPLVRQLRTARAELELLGGLNGRAA